MNRREFDRRSKVAMVKRSTRNGNVFCEIKGCGPLKLGSWEYHHAKQDALEVDKSRRLTEADGLLACKPCHTELSREQAPILAQALRREAQALGVKRRPKQAIKSGGSLRGPTRPHADREPAVGLSQIARIYGLENTK